MTELHSNAQKIPLSQGQRQEGSQHHFKAGRHTANLTLILITTTMTEVVTTMIVLGRLKSMVGKDVQG